MHRVLLGTVLCGLMAACATKPPGAVVIVEPPIADQTAEWRVIAKSRDSSRLDALAGIWSAARSRVAPASRALLKTETQLLDAEGARSHVAPTPGSYRCRLVKLGEGAGARGFRAFSPFFCYMRAESEGRLSFTKQTGSELPGGWIYSDTERRMIFLGVRQEASSQRALRYGEDPARDLAGVVERIGPFRWRLVIPTSEAGLSIYEVTPVPFEGQPPEP